MSIIDIANQLDFSKSDQYTLSIRLGADGFSFAVYNPIDNRFAFYPYAINPTRSMAINVQEMLQKAEALQHAYRQVHVCWVSNRYTLIPFEIFDEEQLEEMLYYNHPKQDNEVVLYNNQARGNIVVAFAMDKTCRKILKEQYPSIRFHAHTSLLIDNLSERSRFGNSKKMYAYVRSNAIDIFCFERGKLLLANSFSCHFAEDKMYYLLYTWKQLAYSQERDELHLFLPHSNKEEFIDKLRKYLRHVFVATPKTDFNYSGDIKTEDIPLELQLLSAGNNTH